MSRLPCLLWSVALGCLLLVPAPAQARPPRASSAPASSSYIPAPVAMGRIRLEVHGDRVLVTTDLTLPRGRGTPRDLDVHVAYGSPGVPLAFDAQLLSTPPGYLVAPVQGQGEHLAHSPSARSPLSATFYLGRPDMAGQLVHVPASILTQAFASSVQATLRIRQIVPLPAPSDSDRMREMVLRLGSISKRPFSLGLIELVADSTITKVEANYCNLQEKLTPLFVSTRHGKAIGKAPPLVERSAYDDLCVRFGAADSRPPSGKNGF